MYRGPQLAESVESGLGPEDGPKPGARSGWALNGAQANTFARPLVGPALWNHVFKGLPKPPGQKWFVRFREASGYLPVRFRESC